MMQELTEILKELPSIETIAKNTVPIAVMAGLAYLTSHYHPHRKDTEQITPYTKRDY